MTDAPKTCYFALRCPKCKHEWVEQIALPMLMSAVTDRMDVWSKRCPDCGNAPCKGSKHEIVVLTGKEHARALKEMGVADGA